MMNTTTCGNCFDTGYDHRGRYCDCNQRPWEDAKVQYHTTCSRRKPLGAWKLDTGNGISVRFVDSKSLWPMYSPLAGAAWGEMKSKLHLRGMEILRNDPTVIAVTVLEW